MTLSPEQLQATFAKYREFDRVVTSAARTATPKTSVWSGLFPFLLKAVPPQAVSDLITNLGKAAIERRREAEADKPVVPVQTKPPPVQKADGPRQPAVSGLVGTLVDDDTAVETAKP